MKSRQDLLVYILVLLGYNRGNLFALYNFFAILDFLILTAAKRSTAITRQLLAFARRQTIAPKVLDLNEAIGNLLNMVRRLIGEDIDLAWSPGREVLDEEKGSTC